MSDIKFYNNNPCKVLRKVSDDFSEIVVFPHVQDVELQGSDWCTACQVGGLGGAHPSHDCEAYQEVIDVVNSLREEEGIVIIADNRLIQDEMVEWKTWDIIKKRCQEMTDSHNETRKQHCDLLIEKHRLKESIKTLKEEAELLATTNDNINQKINKSWDDYQIARDNLQNTKDEQSTMTLDSNYKVDLSLETLRGLIKDSIKLEQLENGGVDNWEWYSDSVDWDNLDEAVDDEIRSYRVEIL